MTWNSHVFFTNETSSSAEMVYATMNRNQYELTERLLLATKESTAAAFYSNKVKRP